jgi:lysophospholipase L1-like esterase
MSGQDYSWGFEMSRARVLCLLLGLTVVIALLPGFFHYRHTDADDLMGPSVYCIGDSLTAADYYEAELRTLLGSSYTVVNKGINGDTTSGMLNRFQVDVLNHDPDFVVIWGGVNDIAWAGLSLATTESNLQSMYTQAHNADMKVIAISMSPWKGTSTWTEAKQASTDSLHDWIMNTATNVDYRIEVYSLLEDPDNPDAMLPAYSGDHLHFNSTGGIVIGQAIYDAVHLWTAKGGLPFWVWIIVGVAAAAGSGLLAYFVRRRLAAQRESSKSARRPTKKTTKKHR